ncbi:hypothetical protein [Xanthocytophaga flava]|uniref:hypothetical protein n=1 Tax=Xanthocytophaga flava TaxID=3048013 RepID=UPI0028D4CF66|nr:hypothetical protein [Xanthocytophaga flavus]MDJ1470226.1 hypothetical protein [Xanthocytophaga flavus]
MKNEILHFYISRSLLIHALILLTLTFSIGLYSCSDEKSTKNDSILINPVANPAIDIDERQKKPLLEGGEKFKGEFIAGFDPDLKTVIRTDPDKPGLLAVSLFANTNTDGAVYYWYDPSKDVLSSKKVDGQKKFSILSLDQTGSTLTEIYYDWEKNTSDTTVYNRK